MFYTLNYLSTDDLKDFYLSVLRNKIFIDAKKKIEDLKKQNYIILLVSASPKIYLKYFEEETYVDMVIATKFKIVNNKATNEIIGEICKGYEKVRKIENFFVLFF